MKMNRSRWWLGVALCATLIAAWFAPPESQEAGVVLSEQHRRPVSEPRSDGTAVSAVEVVHGSRSAGGGGSEVLAIHSRLASEGADETNETELSSLFVAPSWARVHREPAGASPVVTEAVPELAPPPTAPPLPFTIFGRMKEDGKESFFLRYANQTFVVQVGDTLLDTYKVEAVDGRSLQFRYVPLDQVQSLDLGSPS